MFEGILYDKTIIYRSSEFDRRLPLIFASTASLLYPTSTVEKRGDASLNPYNSEPCKFELVSKKWIFCGREHTAKNAWNCSWEHTLFAERSSASSVLVR